MNILDYLPKFGAADPVAAIQRASPVRAAAAAAPAAEAATLGSVLGGAGKVAARAFPLAGASLAGYSVVDDAMNPNSLLNTTATNANVAIDQQIAKGNYLGAAGAGALGLGKVGAALVNSALGGIPGALVGIPNVTPKPASPDQALAVARARAAKGEFNDKTFNGRKLATGKPDAVIDGTGRLSDVDLIAKLSPRELSAVSALYQATTPKPRAAKDVALGDYLNISRQQLAGALGDPKITPAQRKTAYDQYLQALRATFAPPTAFLPTLPTQ